MREMRWPPPRGGAELLIDRPRLTARRLGGLGQTLISGDLDAAVAGLAPAAPMLGLYALLPAGAHALRIGRTSALLVTPAPLVRCGRLARRLVRDQRRRRLGCGRGFRRGRGPGAHAGDLGRPRLRFALGRRPCLWPAWPARAHALRLPRPCRGAVAGDAARLARRGLRLGRLGLVIPDGCAAADRESSTNARRPDSRLTLRGFPRAGMTTKIDANPQLSPASDEPQPGRRMKGAHQQVHGDHSAPERPVSHRGAERLRAAAKSNGHQRHHREGRRGRKAQPVRRDAGDGTAVALWPPAPAELAR